MFSIVDKLTQADIPCLTVHDSIIVQKKYQGLVKLLMNTTTFPDPDLAGWVVGFGSVQQSTQIKFNITPRSLCVHWQKH